MLSLEQAIAQYEQFANVCEHHGLTASQEEFEQLAAWLRELQGRRKEPTTQPSPQWILCTERMPEEHEWIGTKKFGTTISDEVYVTFENEKGERFCRHLQFQNGELSRYDQFHMNTWHDGSKPIAWMPLPEAYKPNK